MNKITDIRHIYMTYQCAIIKIMIVTFLRLTRILSIQMNSITQHQVTINHMNYVFFMEHWYNRSHTRSIIFSNETVQYCSMNGK